MFDGTTHSLTTCRTSTHNPTTLDATTYRTTTHTYVPNPLRIQEYTLQRTPFLSENQTF